MAPTNRTERDKPIGEIEDDDKRDRVKNKDKNWQIQELNIGHLIQVLNQQNENFSFSLENINMTN